VCLAKRGDGKTPGLQAGNAPLSKSRPSGPALSISASSIQEPRLNPFLLIRRISKNCQACVENTKVMTQHSTPLTSQMARRNLAGFMARLGILEIEDKKQKAAF
jgi:hypothetical protein